MTKAIDFHKIIDHYQELIQQTPDDIGLVTNLAWCYERVGQYHDAIQMFHRALGLSQKDFNVHYGLGLALLGNGQQQEALEQFELSRDLVASESSERSEIIMLCKQVEVLVRRLNRS
jgi:tetratricopeptide (TPR) repeat protein